MIAQEPKRVVDLVGRRVGDGEQVFVIAEIGCNFTSFKQGAALIDAAAACGVDAVKLQTFQADTAASSRAMFDMENTGRVNQRELFRSLEIDDRTHVALFDHARECGVLLFSTPGHFNDLERLERWRNPIYKIGSDDAGNLPLLEATARLGRPIILSTGMCTLEEVHEAVATLREAGNESIVLLHCLSNHPAAPEEVNLRAIDVLRAEFPTLPIGYSDHALGNLVAWGAVAREACVIEKHFTLSKKAAGPDHVLSADPAEMRELVLGIRTIERALGREEKRPSAAELRNQRNNRKSLVAAARIRKGETLTREMVDVKRPGDGIPPKHLFEVIGRRAAVDIEPEQSLTWELLA